MSKDYMDEEQELKKTRPIIRNRFDRLIKQSVIGKKPKIIRDELKDRIINDIWRNFETEKKNKTEKRRRREKIIEDNIIRDIRIFFEQEKEEDLWA